MPSGKKLRTTKPEEHAAEPAPVDDTVSVEESAAAVDVTTPTAEEAPAEEAPAEEVPAEEASAEEVPAKQGRRRNFLRRRKNQPTEAAPCHRRCGRRSHDVDGRVACRGKAGDKPVDAEAPTAEAPVAEAADEPVDVEAVGGGAGSRSPSTCR